jgi:hypothetical protein
VSFASPGDWNAATLTMCLNRIRPISRIPPRADDSDRRRNHSSMYVTRIFCPIVHTFLLIAHSQRCCLLAARLHRL